MTGRRGLPEGWGASEVDRYIVRPGQGPAYLIGMLEILRLRDEARAMLGDDFDIDAFHDAVLSHGSVPLAVLPMTVEAWVARSAAARWVVVWPPAAPTSLRDHWTGSAPKRGSASGSGHLRAPTAILGVESCSWTLFGHHVGPLGTPNLAHQRRPFDDREEA